jgi:competence ComEA-like helix-hairpin-helix protein
MNRGMHPSLASILCMCTLLFASAVAAQHAGVVNLNDANAEQLERLPGIGPSRARAILDLRARLKRFTRVEELLRVKGIGRATFRKLRPLITLAGPTTLSQLSCADPRAAARCSPSSA